MDPRSMTLTEAIHLGQQQHPDASGEFTMLIESLGLACKIISREVNRAGLGKMMGLAGRKNIQGEDVAQLDEFANETLVSTLTRCGSVSTIASEELAVPIRLPSVDSEGKYAIAFDPLDGSSNIDVGVTVGTIFSIYRRKSADGTIGDVADLLQPGRALLAAGYALYGSSTILVMSVGRGVQGFTLDPGLGEFLLSHQKITVPPRGKILSVNTGNRTRWSTATRRAVERFESPRGATAPYSMRYVGSMVADVHRTLLKGGLFLYPGDEKAPRGKLRLLYEALPMAFLFDQAGGLGSDGERSLLDLVPEDLHQRVPVILGGRSDVEDFLSAYHNASKDSSSTSG